jgi:hypothetical protein
MKQEQFYERPAITRPAAMGYKEIVKQAGEIYAEFNRNEKMNVRRALEIGRLLTRAKLMSNHDWDETLDEFGIAHQRASEFTWGAAQPLEEQGKWESIGDLRRARAAQNEQKRQGESTTATGSGSSQEKSTNPAAGLLSPPAKPIRQCASCSRKGQNPNCTNCDWGKPQPKAGKACPTCKASRGVADPFCLECKRLNGAKLPPKPSPQPTEDNPREPGDDTAEEATAAKTEEELLKGITSPLLKSMRKLGATYGLKVAPVKRPWEPSVPGWWKEFDPRFQDVLKLLWKARDAFKVLVRQLEEKGPQEIPE